MQRAYLEELPEFSAGPRGPEPASLRFGSQALVRALKEKVLEKVLSDGRLEHAVCAESRSLEELLAQSGQDAFAEADVSFQHFLGESKAVNDLPKLADELLLDPPPLLNHVGYLTLLEEGQQVALAKQLLLQLL